jgi:glucosamine--fructose-6-phosphate aminotransferase (isomerizing)
MCGIFGIISKKPIDNCILSRLAIHSERRGKDSSGLYLLDDNQHQLYRSTESVTRLLKRVGLVAAKVVIGHSRLATNGLLDNQPIYRDSICLIHNGIVVNDAAVWAEIKEDRRQEIDSEVIAAIAKSSISESSDLNKMINRVLSLCDGIVACAMVFPRLGRICLFSNNGSLYAGTKDGAVCFASERFTLEDISAENIDQIGAQGAIFTIPISANEPSIHDRNSRKQNLIPKLGASLKEEKLLKHKEFTGKRCTRCILPETMPFIRFDSKGVCNYCHHYKIRNRPKPISQLIDLIGPYRREIGNDCIIPFSGGRDSCYTLHLAVKELKLKPVTYTYDWGMVTDLGRRNISRMCSRLNIENIIVADDINLKRRNIALNLSAWLKSPHLGMLGLLTAGDKHFFRYVKSVKKQTGISLDLWGVNPLEVTHFKAGFLGVPPDFEEKMVYSNGLYKQLRYQLLRFKRMIDSPGYFNRSLWDTLSGEYYRSFATKSDYFHIFDYSRWDENTIDKVLINSYDWELAPDTRTTWRIGDGTAAFYNYIYYTIAGFSEHDTFRSNQIREGDLTRHEALNLVNDENRPRYPNIKWYLDAIGMDYTDTMTRINSIPSLWVG